LKEFSKQQRGNVKKGNVGICRECDRARNIRRLYGIEPEEYESIMKKQHDACAICTISFAGGKKKNIHVDHSHETQNVRGILCNNCNIGLGHIDESTATITNMIIYLYEHQSYSRKDMKFDIKLLENVLAMITEKVEKKEKRK
jgi:hypothetical protein